MVLSTWTRRGLALAAASLSLALLTSGPTDAKDPLPKGTAEKLAAADIEFLKAGLEKGPTAKGVIKGLKSTAMLLALNAQNNTDGDSGAKFAGLRDQALKIAGALETGKVADAKTAAAALSTTATGDPKKSIKLAEQHKFSLDEAMAVLGSARAGGMNIENEFKDKEVDKTLKDTKKVELYGARIALIGQYSLDLPSNEAVGAKKKKWDDWSKEMSKLGSELAAEAGKATPDTAALKKKIAAINKNCTDCHNEFRK